MHMFRDSHLDDVVTVRPNNKTVYPKKHTLRAAVPDATTKNTGKSTKIALRLGGQGHTSPKSNHL